MDRLDSLDGKEIVKMRDKLIFEKEPFNEGMMESGGKSVRYRLYPNRLYCARPIDADYQCLTIYEPIECDGKAIDASDAPILLMNRCGGYMSHSTVIEKKFPPRPKKDPAIVMKVGPAPGEEGKGAIGGDDAIAPFLCAGIVVVIPGNRGRDLVTKDGKHIGKAPSMIVDLKAAVRYIRHNKGRMAGDVDHIISKGCSAGGGLSALLGVTGNAAEYEPYLEEIGAAKESDDIFASIAISPVTNLEHQDEAYEWQYGKLICNGFDNRGTEKVNQEQSKILSDRFETYFNGLKLVGRDGFGALNTQNYKEYYLKEFVIPSATKWLNAQDDELLMDYLSERPWLHYEDKKADFTFEEYEHYLGRLKGLPAFDGIKIGRTENSAFGTQDTDGEHYTQFSLEHDPDATGTEISELVEMQKYLLNPVTHLLEHHGDTVEHWWIRMAAKESGFACPIDVSLVTLLENRGYNVNFRLVWDGGHCAEDDLDDQVQWVLDVVQA